jgi:HNH endonuclease/NUMOD4 motif
MTLFVTVKPEVWRTISEAPRYMVSSHGRVQSGPAVRGGSKILALDFTDRYPRVTLCLPGGVRLTRRVHELVAEAFIGVRPEGQVCRHKNDDPMFNHKTNLEYGTQKENIADSKANGKRRDGLFSPLGKLTLEQVLEIRGDPRYRYRPDLYALKFEVSKACVVDARVGKTYKDVV